MENPVLEFQYTENLMKRLWCSKVHAFEKPLNPSTNDDEEELKLLQG